jgi:hypothetical protein
MFTKKMTTLYTSAWDRRGVLGIADICKEIPRNVKTGKKSRWEKVGFLVTG